MGMLTRGILTSPTPRSGGGGEGGPVAWNDVLSKPSTFPSAWDTIANKPELVEQSSLAPVAYSGSVDDIADIPFPTTPGAEGQVLTTDESGNIVWANAPATGLQAVVEDTAPVLGGDLDGTGRTISAAILEATTVRAPTGNMQVSAVGGRLTLGGQNPVRIHDTQMPPADVGNTVEVGQILQVVDKSGFTAITEWVDPPEGGGGGGLTALVDDPAPTLGGNLNTGSHQITLGTLGFIKTQESGLNIDIRSAPTSYGRNIRLYTNQMNVYGNFIVNSVLSVNVNNTLTFGGSLFWSDFSATDGQVLTAYDDNGTLRIAFRDAPSGGGSSSPTTFTVYTLGSGLHLVERLMIPGPPSGEYSTAMIRIEMVVDDPQIGNPYSYAMTQQTRWYTVGNGMIQDQGAGDFDYDKNNNIWNHSLSISAMQDGDDYFVEINIDNFDGHNKHFKILRTFIV